MSNPLVEQKIFHSSRSLAISKDIVSESYSEASKRADLALTMMDFLTDATNPHTCGISLGDIMECCYSHPPKGYVELHDERQHKYINAKSWTQRDQEVFELLINMGIESPKKSIRVQSAVEALKRSREIFPDLYDELNRKYDHIFKEAGLR